MNLTESLEAKRAELEAIPSDQVKVPSISVNNFVQKSEKLYLTCVHDQQELQVNGINWSIVEDLPVRNRALLQANTLWHQKRTLSDDAMSQWKREADLGYQLANRLIHIFRFAFSGNEALSSRVKEISEIYTHADMIAGLNDLSELGTANAGLLAAVNFDMTLLAQAKQKADELTRLWATATLVRQQEDEDKNLRDRAYTHLKQATDYTRKYGKYVFRWDPERLKFYIWSTAVPVVTEPEVPVALKKGSEAAELPLAA